MNLVKVQVHNAKKSKTKNNTASISLYTVSKSNIYLKNQKYKSYISVFVNCHEVSTDYLPG